MIFSDSSRCAYCHRILDPVDWSASDTRATRDHIWPRTLKHLRPDPTAPNTVWACFVCNHLKSDMPPCAWHAFILATPHWWTTPVMFEERLAAIRRYYDPAHPRDIRSTATIAGIGLCRRTRPMPDRTSLDSYFADYGSSDPRASANDQPTPRAPTLAEIEALCVEHGTSIAQIDLIVVVLARELIEIKQHHVTTSEIAAYGDEQVHQLAPLFAAIDAARSMEHRVAPHQQPAAMRWTCIR